ncbi:putative O-methyltransferase [Novipirellula aureliae]|uniref:Putative O-methyltransferase n=1 Tax=Novipirellula aureliae TaxID=2527966 RepID=A0A5C6DLC0_9BACT|nr:O-methyltransferase [Novipirellula aureliae]TWU35709.1 putative O-methyltransferase [Novipirellula aureliae]
MKTSIQFASCLFAAVVFLSMTAMVHAQQRGTGRAPSGDRSTGDIELEKPPVPLDEFEQTALKVLGDIQANQAFRNVPENDGRLLRIMAQSMGAKNVVELGTSTGISGIWLGLGLKETGGHLTTYEIDSDRAAKARENFKRAGLSDVITVVEGDAHEKLKDFTGTVDMVFLDADKEGYIDYLNTLMPMLRPGGLILAHNINPRMAHPPFMEAITTDPNLDTVVRGGMSITLKKK